MLYNNPQLLSVWAAGNDRNETWASLDTYYLTMLVGGGYNGWYWVPVIDLVLPAPAADGSQAGGYDCLPQEQTAKNTLVVGAVNDITDDPYNSVDVTMTTFSSWGPTDDGRVKPDVVANGYRSLYAPVHAALRHPPMDFMSGHVDGGPELDRAGRPAHRALPQSARLAAVPLGARPRA